MTAPQLRAGLLAQAQCWRLSADELRQMFKVNDQVPFSVETSAVTFEVCAQWLEEFAWNGESRKEPNDETACQRQSCNAS